MTNRIFAMAIYFFMFSLGMVFCGNFMGTEDMTEYKKAIKSYELQLSHEDIYSPVFARNISETATDVPREKTIYLTFDDGPTPRTGEVLDILDKYEIKATFFVIKTKDEYAEHMQRAASSGHTIGVHSSSHRYKEIYSSVENYLNDFSDCYEYIYERTGQKPTIFRFPGGSVNNYNSVTRKEIVREMIRRGYVYFDWNVESGDSGKLSSDTIYNNVINGCKGKQRAVIIFHDSINKQSTVQALERIIEKLQSDGWIFRPLTNEVKPMIFKMK